MQNVQRDGKYYGFHGENRLASISLATRHVDKKPVQGKKMKTALLFLLLLTACGSEKSGLQATKWLNTERTRRWEFDTTTVKDFKRTPPNGDWEQIGTYRWTLENDVITFTKENNETVLVFIQFHGDNEMRIMKYGGVVSWIPTTFQRLYNDVPIL